MAYGIGSRIKASQQGLTLVELLVAMAISLVIAIAAVASLIISRQGFTSVDASSQLRDNARFAMDLIQRIGVQTGYQTVQFAGTIRSPNNAKVSTDPYPNVFGFNNATPSFTDPLNTATARTGASSIGYGSDILILRYQADETFPGSGALDKTMIDCTGTSPTLPADIPQNQDDRMASIFYIGVSQNDTEPSLMCSNGPNLSQPLIRGVENFQVLYGVDNVTAITAPSGTTDGVPDAYLRADQLTVSGNDTATRANWRRVRSLRLGMVIRGAPGSSQDRVAQTFYPFGLAKNASGGTAGSALSSANDAGTIFAPTPDGRLRQVVTFTVHLRNPQTQGIE